MSEPWEVLGSYQAADYVIFKARIDTLRSPRGAQGDFIILECPEWVNVVALTEDRQAIMVRQFRHGVRCAGLEFPGGMVDPGESPLAAARRELLEETGYEASEWRELGFVHPDTGQPVVFTAPLPPRLDRVLSHLRQARTGTAPVPAQRTRRTPGRRTGTGLALLREKGAR